MYSIKNEKDVSEILKYHRAKDMVNILKYFPGLSPIDDLAVITDENDYLNNKDKLTNLTSVRNGNPISEPCMKSIPVKDINPNVIEIMKEIKLENPKGVLILFHVNAVKTERYERYAGISVGISLHNKIYIDAVSKGFDGREVLKGISCHERYMIPWGDIRRVNIENFKSYRTYLINNKDYLKSREERVNYLVSCGIDRDIIEKHIPVEYQEIPDFIWMSIIRDIIKVLEKEEDLLESSGFYEFNLSGHTEGRVFAPWQMADDKRL